MHARLALFLTPFLLLVPGRADAQTMQQLINRLFVFSGGEGALVLGGSAGLPATQVHGAHYIPAETETNGALLAFFERSISDNVAAFPLSSTVASQTYEFVDGVPRPTSSSFGPIYAERAATVGRGRFNVGANASRVAFSHLRGVPMEDLRLTFVHQNVDFPNCDEVFGGDCSALGIPQAEHDVLELNLDLDIAATIFAMYGTFGVADWLDLSFALPVVSLSLDGSSVAQIVPNSSVPVLHFFSGTPEEPVLSSQTSVRGETTGVGDVAVRLKAQFLRGTGVDMALLGEVRAPTGQEENFLGTGEWGWRGLFIASGEYGGFAPHTNLGYTRRGQSAGSDFFEGAVGFDQRVSSSVTLAVDVLGLFTLGSGGGSLGLAPVVLEEPYRREVRLTNIPDVRDDQVNGALGFKFRTGGGVIVVTNALVPLNRGGLRSNWVATVGVEMGR